jgi:ribosome-binding protein aMBF1 (putative translation factor)
MAPDSAAIEAHNHAENQKSYAKIIKGQKDQEIVDYVKSDYARKAQTAVVENRDASPAELAKNVSERKEVERRSEGVGGKIDETPYNARWRNRPDSGYE